MAPKLPVKRRIRDEDSPGRLPKKQGKGGKKEPTYDTYDDALDGGVEMEEKGERYRDGDKAQRFYERAAELYQKAMQYDETFDATYNLARVQYTLASSFLLPPSSLEIYGSAIALYRRALDMTSSTNLQMDASFNLAQACVSLADATEEYHGDSAADGVRELREAGCVFLEKVLVSQEEYIRTQAEAVEVDQASEAMDEEAMGEETTHEATAVDETEIKIGDDDDDKMEADDDQGGDDDDAEGEGTATFETHLPTPSALIDTALALVDLRLAIWESVTPTQQPTEEAQGAVRGILDVAAAYTTPGRQAEIDLAEVKVLLTLDRIVWDMFKAEARPGMGLEKGLEGAAGALSALLLSLDTQPPDDPSVRADILTTLADTESAIASRLSMLSPHLPPGPSPLAQQSWSHLSSAIGYLNKALELPVVSGTPREFKPNVLLTLSRASLARARLAPVNETARQNEKQLLLNSIAYATRAADALGWQLPSPDAPKAAKLVPPFPSGWETEHLARSAVLLLLRVYYVAYTGDLDFDTKAKYQNAATLLVHCLQTVEAEPRRVSRRDVERWVEDVEDEQGPIGSAERAWWRDLATSV